MGYELNQTAMRSEAQKIAEREARKSNGGGFKKGEDFRWYDFVRGAQGQVLRILPPGPDSSLDPFIPDGHAAMMVWNHVDIPGYRGQKFRCVTMTYPNLGISCPICDAMGELREWFKSEGVPWEEQKVLLGDYKLKARAFTNCISRSGTKFIEMKTGEEVDLKDMNPEDLKSIRFGKDPKYAPVVYILNMPPSLYNNIVLQSSNEDSGIGNYTDEIKGMDILVTVTGEGFNTEYKSQFIPDANGRPVHADDTVRKFVLSKMFNISRIWKAPDDAAMDKIRLAANGLKKLIGSSITSPRQEAQGSSSEYSTGLGSRDGTAMDGREATAAPVAETTPLTAGVPTGAPACWSNHIEKHRKCLYCDFEIPCISATSKIEGLTLELKQANHEKFA